MTNHLDCLSCCEIDSSERGASMYTHITPQPNCRRRGRELGGHGKRTGFVSVCFFPYPLHLQSSAGMSAWQQIAVWSCSGHSPSSAPAGGKSRARMRRQRTSFVLKIRAPYLGVLQNPILHSARTRARNASHKISARAIFGFNSFVAVL